MNRAYEIFVHDIRSRYCSLDCASRTLLEIWDECPELREGWLKQLGERIFELQTHARVPSDENANAPTKLLFGQLRSLVDYHNLRLLKEFHDLEYLVYHTADKTPVKEQLAEIRSHFMLIDEQLPLVRTHLQEIEKCQNKNSSNG